MWPRAIRLHVAVLAFAFALVAVFAPPAGASPWTFDAAAFVYVPSDDDEFVSPVLAADRGALHVEARYNYEDLETGSAFIGRNVDFRDENVHGTIVPIFGIVLGNTAGIAPGFNFELDWGRFAFTSESELVMELPEWDRSFLYSWIEATLEPIKGVRLGVAGQRTKLEETGLEARRGPMLSLSGARGWVGAYWFDPDHHDEQTLVFAAGFSF